MFDLAVFITYLRNTGLSRSMADKYGAYARAACNAGQDPTDNAGFASHVASYASSTRARRRSAWRHYQRMLDLELLPDALSHQHTAPTPGVDGFAEWLHNDRGLAESAATAYKSIIRTAIKAVGDTPTREDLEVWLSTRSMSYRARLPTVWRYWRQYNDGQVVDLEVAQNVPDTVAHAAWWLASRCAIRLVDLRAMCWRDIREHDDGTADIRYLPDPSPGRHYRQRASASVIAACRGWSLPHDDDAPLLPSDSGGAVAMTRKQLHDVVTRGAQLVADGYQAAEAGPGSSTRPPMRVPWNSDAADTPTEWKAEKGDFGSQIK